jgi:cleavage stimulation factor subunit 3
MADMDPELAFLSAQNEYDPASVFPGTAAVTEQPAPADEEDEEEEYDPSTAYPSYPAQSNGSPSSQSASMPESAANSPPAAAEGGLKPQPAAVAAPSPSKQPRTMGGFVVESEDEEDEVPAVSSHTQAAGSAMLNANGVSSPQRSLNNTPSNTLAPPNVPLHSAQDLGQSGVVPSPSVTINAAASIQSPAVPNGGGTPVPDITKTGAPDLLSAASARPSTAPTPVPASLPKQRLPQDRIGILEDRVAEDPRGDIEAWQSLIEEHRRRHKIDDARAVYERFFKVFPTAVSSLHPNRHAMHSLTLPGRVMDSMGEHGDRPRRVEERGAHIRAVYYVESTCWIVVDLY